jgi:hypothetical protein
MTLYLIEASLKGIVSNKEQLEHKVATLQEQLKQQSAELIEVQVSNDYARSFFIIEGAEQDAAVEVLKTEGISADLVKDVRLVGKELEAVKSGNDVINYLVEWNLPEDLTMDQYLARKKKNSVHYEEVPEVEFSRTYVCEDMSKCLCFYDAPDEAAVKRAREAVKTPIDSITEIQSN